MALDGSPADGGCSSTEGIDGEFGRSDGPVRSSAVDGDDSDQREAVEDVVDEVRVVMVGLLEAPLKESRVWP